MYFNEHEFQPYHLTASRKDFLGNGDIGKYVILTGSDQRARDISLKLSNVSIKTHPRHHNLYFGNITAEKSFIEIAVVSTGMGCSSLDIIVNELLLLGAKRLIRVGTAGSLQLDSVKTGDLVIATAAVRDEETSSNYIYSEFPAIASLETVIAAQRAANKLDIKSHVGIVHTKTSLYAREFNFSFLKENANYMDNMRLSGVLASEMESSHLFILAQINKQKVKSLYKQDVLVGSILSIVGDTSPFSDESWKIQTAIEKGIELGIETIKELYAIDTGKKSLT